MTVYDYICHKYVEHDGGIDVELEGFWQQSGGRLYLFVGGTKGKKDVVMVDLGF